MQFPSAKIRASSLDAFAEELWNSREELAIPSFAGEIGDGWLNGGGSDPWRNAAFRAGRQLRNKMIADGTLNSLDPALTTFEFRSLVHPEHNWGLSGLNKWDVKGFKPSFGNENPGPDYNWTNTAFHMVQHRQDYDYWAGSWTEGRDYLMPLPATGVESADFQAFRHALAREYASLRPPDTFAVSTPGADEALQAAGYTAVLPNNDVPPCGGSTVRFDPVTGAVIALSAGGTIWSSLSAVKAAAREGLASRAQQPLVEFVYRTYNESDFDYMTFVEPPVKKPGMDAAASPESREWRPTLESLWVRQHKSHRSVPGSDSTAVNPSCEYLAKLVMPTTAHERYGAPQSLLLNVTLNTRRTGCNSCR